MEEVVLIVGAGPSGLATAACLNKHLIPYIILEREDCCGSLWKKRTYDRLKLHLAKGFCHLPHQPHPPSAPNYIPKKDFIRYMDDYVSNFNIAPRYRRSVESATYDEITEKWRVMARNLVTNEMEEYLSRFLVVATGENSEAVIPNIPGLNSFNGTVLHSNDYKSGIEFVGKSVLVVGSGNSGMEISYDLATFGVQASIVVRSKFHVLTKEMVHLGMFLLRYLPLSLVDSFISVVGNLKYGDLSKYGIQRPRQGPFFIKATTGTSAVIDVGTIGMIKKGEIQVLPGLTSINGSVASFEDGSRHSFDTIIFATGYRSTVHYWLKDNKSLMGENGMPKNRFPHHWKGRNGLYCTGFASRGLDGVSADAQNVANDIKESYTSKAFTLYNHK